MKMRSGISHTEKEVISRGCELGVRRDGRTNVDFRPMSIENDIIPNVHGSSKVTIGGQMCALCCIRASVQEIIVDKLPIDISVKIPSAGGKSDANNSIEKITSERLIKLVSSSNIIQFDKLIVIPSRLQWVLTVDIVVMDIDGDISDICSLALNSALFTAKIPKFTVISDENGIQEDYEISSHLLDAVSLPLTGNLCIFVSIFKIGNTLVLDCVGDEQSCADFGLTIGVTESEEICDFYKTLKGYFTQSDISLAMKAALEGAVALFSFIKNQSIAMVDYDGKYADVPANRIGFLN